MPLLRPPSCPRTARRVDSFRRVGRTYHDRSFGARPRTGPSVPEYSPGQLHNRAHNASLLRYVDNMRLHGHRAANIDPLGLTPRRPLPAVNPARYGLHPEQSYDINGILYTDDEDRPKHWALERIVQRLQSVYLGTLAHEYMHSISKAERLWFSRVLEGDDHAAFYSDDPARRRIWELLVRSEIFDQFLHLRFPGLKRYGLEGSESMLPALDTLFQQAALAGASQVVLAMPHRGRLNLLVNVLKYPTPALFYKLKGGAEVPSNLNLSGDVVSHLVATSTLQYSEQTVQVQVLPNPSHLEAINPVALGVVRAKQSRLSGTPLPPHSEEEVIPVHIHGDASFTGQGVVMECFSLSNLPHFTTGGSIHIVLNNNIGYTTPASGTRSSLYCSDVAKMINAPILHVNGDYPEDVTRAVKIAFEYRRRFKKDIVLDLLVYRRWGHNELDEPAFTQPSMYNKIRARNSVPKLYEAQLISNNVLSQEVSDQVRREENARLGQCLAQTREDLGSPSTPTLTPNALVWPTCSEAVSDPETGANLDLLRKVGNASVEVPKEFKLHSRLLRHVRHRKDVLTSGEGIDWSTAEALAFGSLLEDGYNVRISGQDVGRGTFSQRHAMLVDQVTENVTVPLNDQLSCLQKLELANSPLSEMAVLGFEYGMSWENPDLLTLWEAQFGDFCNGAQVIIDNIIANAETKWMKQSGLVMLLPHGLDGGGPEHSSMRLERFLQLSNDRVYGSYGDARRVNIQVANPSTPAQYFHLLRRQMKRNYRKPLIVATPKAMLRSPLCVSSLADMSEGKTFQPVLSSHSNRIKSTSIIACSGKIFYELLQEQQKQRPTKDVAIIRLEEICPFPFSALERVLDEVEALKVIWVQEEARNQGAWTHVEPRLGPLVRARGMSLEYWGRDEDSVAAVGIGRLHEEQRRQIVEGVWQRVDACGST